MSIYAAMAVSIIAVAVSCTSGCCSLTKDKPSQKDGAKHCLPIDPRLAQYYTCVTPISVEGLRVICLFESEFVLREKLLLERILKSGDIEEVRVVAARALSAREEELADLESSESRSILMARRYMVQDAKMYLFNFEHPLYHDYGVIVVRDDRIILRDGGPVGETPEELDMLGFEPSIDEL